MLSMMEPTTEYAKYARMHYGRTNHWASIYGLDGPVYSEMADDIRRMYPPHIAEIMLRVSAGFVNCMNEAFENLEL
jgi:hypothetical protein